MPYPIHRHAGLFRTGCVLLFLASLASPVRAEVPAPPLGALANLTYPGIEEAPVTLHDGTWEGAPFVAGGASRPRVTLVPGFRVTGDLDGDGAPEAVVLLAESSGGSGTFSHVAVVSAGPVVRGVAPVGDRVQLRYARVEQGRLVIDTVEAGEGDAACCPGELRQRRWRLGDAGLQELPAETLGRLGPESLGGGLTWRLVELDPATRVPAQGAPTLTYENGQLAGFAGCNRYFGAVEPDAVPGSVKFGPLGSTRRLCEEEANALESAFLGRLAAVEKIGFLAGQLVLTWRDGERTGSLRFVAE